MKKSLLSIIILLLLFAFISCGEQQGDEPPKPDPKPDPEPTTSYSISWYDENGTKLSTTTVDEGTVPSYNYNVTDTAEWDYTFDGWSASQNGDKLSSIPAANADASYYAKVSKVKQKYTLSFSTGEGASSVTSVTQEYGTSISAPETAPTREGFKFMAWFSDAEFKNEVVWPITLEKNVTVYAKWNEKVDIAKYLKALLEGYELSPYSYIPEALRPAYSANAISGDLTSLNYESGVNVSDIPSQGFGEQWNMIIENLTQTEIFLKALSVVETISTSAVTAFNNYLDTNPASTAQYNFKDGIYNVYINFDGKFMSFVVDYTDAIASFGQTTAQIAMKLNIETGEKTVRMQLGDANAIAYTLNENSCDIAVKYLGVRTAYFSATKADDGKVSGHIYEYLTIEGHEIGSAADFYIDDSYAVAVGNKASGTLGFTGTIAEVYNSKTGKLLGYEVEETLSSVTYNTYWFDLKFIEGINSIKTDAEGFYVNGSQELFEAMKVGGFSLKTASRRFDIEFRKQYFYTYNAASEKYEKVSINVPMMFIQEENYATFVADMLSTNGISAVVSVGNATLQKISSSYDELIPIFKQNKANMSSSVIISFIGEKINVSA